MSGCLSSVFLKLAGGKSWINGSFWLFLKKVELFCRKMSKKFAVVKIVRIFAIPKQSGGGEMVDTLL